MSTSATGETFQLSAGGYDAAVTEVGATIQELRVEGRPLLLGAPPGQMVSGGRGQVLAPWPNRIDGGRYRFQGRELQLPITEVGKGNASHGLVRWLPWTIDRDGSDRLVASRRIFPQPGYPFRVDLTVTYELGPAGLRVDVHARNGGDGPAPYGHGMHPYLRPCAGRVDDWVLVLPARTMCEVDERGLPGRRTPAPDGAATAPIGGHRFDHPFTDLRRDDDGLARISLSDPVREVGVTMWLDAGYRWVQLYTGDDLAPYAREALAVEPMTCPANAFVSGDDLIVLAPGEEHHASWGLSGH